MVRNRGIQCDWLFLPWDYGCHFWWLITGSHLVFCTATHFCACGSRAVRVTARSPRFSRTRLYRSRLPTYRILPRTLSLPACYHVRAMPRSPRVPHHLTSLPSYYCAVCLFRSDRPVLVLTGHVRYLRSCCSLLVYGLYAVHCTTVIFYPTAVPLPGRFLPACTVRDIRTCYAAGLLRSRVRVLRHVAFTVTRCSPVTLVVARSVTLLRLPSAFATRVVPTVSFLAFPLLHVQHCCLATICLCRTVHLQHSHVLYDATTAIDYRACFVRYYPVSSCLPTAMLTR